MRKTRMAFEVEPEDGYDVWASISITEAEPCVGEVFRVASNKRYSGHHIRPQSTAEVVSYTVKFGDMWIMKMNYCPEKPENPCDRDFMVGISNGVA